MIHFFLNPFFRLPQENYFFTCPRCTKHFLVKQKLKIGDRIKCYNPNCTYEYHLQGEGMYPWRLPFGIAYNPDQCCGCGTPNDPKWQKIYVDQQFFFKSKIRSSFLDSRQCIFRGVFETFNRSKYLSDNFVISKVSLIENPEIRNKFEKYITEQQTYHPNIADKFVIQELDALRKHSVYRLSDLIVVKGWHGAHWSNVNSIGAKGFLNLKTTDEGYFGSGVYFAPQLEYAVRYSTGQLVTGKGYRPNLNGEFVVIMSFLAIAKPYYITWNRDGDIRIPSKCRLACQPIVEGFDSHYVRVDQSFVLPEPSIPPMYEEIVLRNATLQALPCVALYYKLKNQADY